MGKWPLVRLGDVCTINMGQSPSSESYNDVKDGIPFYQGNADFGEVHPEARLYCNKPVKIANKNDVLLSVRAPIGALNIANEKCCIGRGLCAITENENISYYKYIYYALKRKKEELIAKGTGSTFKAINKTSIESIKIPLPPLDVQKHIANILDKTQEIIDGHKKQLAELNNLIKAVFCEMFGDPINNENGWGIKTLKEISKEPLSYGSGASAVDYDGDVRYIRITDINEDGSLNSEIVSPNVIDTKYILNDGDILFARSGATVGKTLRFRESFGKCIYAGYLIKFVPNEEFVLPDYIYYYTKTNFYKRFIESNIKTVAQPNINARQYGELKIVIPPLDLQNKFAEIVTKIEEQKALVKQAIAESEHLFKSLMSEYFD